MQIYGPFRLSTAQNAGGVQRSQAQSPQQLTPKKTAAPVDQLDLSSAASGINRLEGAVAGGGEIRIDKVADIRRQIADGSYDTPEKLDAALDRMLDQFA
ncbi:Anti-sigma-28 factor, FlgM [Planctomycetes bacterium CA13]|uniref:Anti-sigma-28 factor, FlgM n=1 Tax=Novipirellula herctigrandis TaxID=2527986 RepID=A0A5C5Z7C3_9BACT|nr:Anti-sigma-28 factor, FlgM [Planctomycetes bacterium CA13]